LSEVRAGEGATPEGSRSQGEAAEAVRAMFDAVAPRYDLLNHVLSVNIDRLWWWRTARMFREVLARPEARVMDVCCGTGDMTRALLKHRPKGAVPVVGLDFSHGMLLRGVEKFRRLGGAVAVEGDALRLPVAEGSLDLVTSAFGFRNLANYRAGLEEFRRVLRPGGQVGILDFSEPEGWLGRVYAWYFRRVLPAIGEKISGQGAAYRYLPASVERFPAPERMMAMMREAGFVRVSWRPYSWGIAGVFRGVRG
jgi:demethylmenaquinone methyltransferase / 2-methoxy-6-polyprenyl-1,4-benzoquinol methylase